VQDILGQFGSFGFTMVAFVVALSIIVAIHEYGHYIVGRWCGIDADVFSLGFGPVLYSRVDKRGTQWQVAALPFGGYVKFAGDANAASVGGDSDVPRARNTMMGAPLWARSLTVAAGPVFNFILSFLIFMMFALIYGTPSQKMIIAEMTPLPDSYVQELQVGDEVLEIAGMTVPDYDVIGPFLNSLPIEKTLDYRVLRNGEEITVQAPHPRPPVASGVSLESAARDAGVEVGDVITAVGGTPIWVFDELVAAVAAADGGPVDLTVQRGDETLEFSLTPRVTAEPTAGGGFQNNFRIGIAASTFYQPATESVGLWTAITGSVGRVWDIIAQSISGLGAMITGQISTCNLSGPIGIAQASGAMASQGGVSFISFVALLSTAVGLLNLFPVPVLDGGHLVFHAYEAVTGREPSEGALRVLMALGLGLILTLMVFAVFTDMFC
jgi:regulator of sigma E protease